MVWLRLTKEVTFRDRHGTILKTYPIGHTVLCTGKTSYYFITKIGDIYFDEAEEV